MKQQFADALNDPRLLRILNLFHCSLHILSSLAVRLVMVISYCCSRPVSYQSSFTVVSDFESKFGVQLFGGTPQICHM